MLSVSNVQQTARSTRPVTNVIQYFAMYLTYPFEILHQLREVGAYYIYVCEQKSADIATTGPILLVPKSNKMVEMRGVQQPAIIMIISCTRSLLWTLTCAAFLFFFWALFARPTYWYGDDPSGHFGKMWHGMEVPLRALEKQVKNVDSPVMGGENNSMVSVLSPQSNASFLRCDPDGLMHARLDACTNGYRMNTYNGTIYT